jgi:hypothetical protein
MKNRSRLAWLGALGLILAVPPVASSVVGDLGAASSTSEHTQNNRLDRHSARLSKHGRDIRRLNAEEYGVARLWQHPGRDGAENTAVWMLTTPNILTAACAVSSCNEYGQSVRLGVVLPLESTGGEELTLRGVTRSSKPGGTAKAAGVMEVVCAPIGKSTCAGGTVSAGEAVCQITGNYNSGTGVLTLVDVRNVGLADGSAPTASDRDIAGGTCTLPPGGGNYTVSLGIWNEPNFPN